MRFLDANRARSPVGSVRVAGREKLLAPRGLHDSERPGAEKPFLTELKLVEGAWAS